MTFKDRVLNRHIEICLVCQGGTPCETYSYLETKGAVKVHDAREEWEKGPARSTIHIDLLNKCVDGLIGAVRREDWLHFLSTQREDYCV